MRAVYLRSRGRAVAVEALPLPAHRSDRVAGPLCRRLGSAESDLFHRVGDVLDIRAHRFLSLGLLLLTQCIITQCVMPGSSRRREAFDELLGEGAEDVVVGDAAPLLGLDPLRPEAVLAAPLLESRPESHSMPARPRPAH